MDCIINNNIINSSKIHPNKKPDDSYKRIYPFIDTSYFVYKIEHKYYMYCLDRFIYSNYSYLYGACRFTSGSYRETQIVIQNQSWRTMTMLFKTGNLAEITNGQTRYLLQYGELTLGITRTGSNYNFSVIFNGTTDTMTGINLQPNSTYYIIVMQDFATDSQSTKTTKLSACCADIASFTANANLPFNGTAIQRYINDGNGTPLWTKAETNYKLAIGGKNSEGIVQTVIMDVGWVRFFDYVFTPTDLTNDMTNNWMRSWWNMV
jgi:hypothetical protein